MQNGVRTAAEDVKDDEFTHRVIGCAMTVHRKVGCGLLEKAYEEFFSHELIKQSFAIARQSTLPVVYDGVRVDLAYTPDIVVDGQLIIELKTVTKLLPVHTAQLLTYLRLSGITRGLLINFHAQPLSTGIKRVVLSYQSMGLSPRLPLHPRSPR